MHFVDLVSQAVLNRQKRLDYLQYLLKIRSKSKKWRSSSAFMSPAFLMVDTPLQRACLGVGDFNGASIKESFLTLKILLAHGYGVAKLGLNIIRYKAKMEKGKYPKKYGKNVDIGFSASGETSRVSSVPSEYIAKFIKGDGCRLDKVIFQSNGGLDYRMISIVSFWDYSLSIFFIFFKNLNFITKIRNLQDLHLFWRELINYPLVSCAITGRVLKRQKVEKVFIVSENLPREYVLEHFLGNTLFKVNTSKGFRFDRANLFFGSRCYFSLPKIFSFKPKSQFLLEGSKKSQESWTVSLGECKKIILVAGFMDESLSGCKIMEKEIKSKIDDKPIYIRNHPRNEKTVVPGNSPDSFYICCSSTNHAAEIYDLKRVAVVDLALQNGANPFVHLGIPFFEKADDLIKALSC